MVLRLTIKGRPITKKNSSRYVGHGRLLPSVQYVKYEKAAVPQLQEQLKDKVITDNVSVKVLYYLPNRVGWPDLVGLMQATGDILEKAGVIKNDRQIVSWNGTRIVGIDKLNPRAEIEIEVQ